MSQSWPVGNHLLAALPPEAYEQLVPDLQPVTFSLGEVIYESGGSLGYVYFPTTSLVSLLYTMANGSTAEMGLTGNDGVVGIALFLGGDTTPNRAVVQIAGDGFRRSSRGVVRFNSCCCAILRHSLRRSRRQLSAIDFTPWRSASAAGCC